MAEVAEWRNLSPQASFPPCCVIKNESLIFMLELISTDILRREENVFQKVRGIEMMRLLGDEANPYNRMK